MKKAFLIAGLTAFLLGSNLDVRSQQKEKDKKEQKGNGKGQVKKAEEKKGHIGKGNPGKGEGAPASGNNGNNKTDGGKGNEKDAVADRGNGNANGKGNDVAKGKGRDIDYDRKGIYTWTRETFRDRARIRNGEKVSICHKPEGDEGGVTIRVSVNALQAHLDHGDVRGECPDVVDNRYTDDFLRRRTDYYNLLQEYDEQQLYSRSILDYALLRLSGARQELVALQNNGAPSAEIERRQVVVGELEQNASLLEILLAEAANLL